MVALIPISYFLNLEMLNFILNKTLTVGLISIVIIFLASSFFSNYFSKSNDSLYIITKEVDTINTNLLNKINNDFNDIDSLKEAFNESISSLTSVSEIVDNNYNENAEYKKIKTKIGIEI